MRYRFARLEGTRAPVMNALPLRYMSAILLNVQGKMSALSAFTPPPPRLLYEGERLFCVCGGRRCQQAARECNGVWLGRMPARQTLYHTLVLVCGRASHRVHPKMGASFWLPLGSYAGMLSPLLWTTPNLGCTPLTGRIPDHWEDLPDHWRLRPGRWVWPHLTDNQLACTHNNPGYTRTRGYIPNFGHTLSEPGYAGFVDGQDGRRWVRGYRFRAFRRIVGAGGPIRLPSLASVLRLLGGRLLRLLLAALPGPPVALPFRPW